MSGDRHGGNVWRLAQNTGVPVDELLDFSASINPLGPPDWLRNTINASIRGLIHYPDPECRALTEALATCHGISEEMILPSNGSAELLMALPRAVNAKRALICVPSYVDYRIAAESAGVDVVALRTDASEGFRIDCSRLREKLLPGDLVFLAQPNNPTGIAIPPGDIRVLANEYETCNFVVDEAYIDFSTRLDSLINDRPNNVIVLRSFTKILAIPGLRLGYGVATKSIVSRLRCLLPSWSVNHLAQSVGVAAISRRGNHTNQTRVLVEKERILLADELDAIQGMSVFPGVANFLLLRITRPDLDAESLARRLLETEKIAVRTCTNFEGLDRRYLRVAVRSRKENERLCDGIDRIMGSACVRTTRACHRKTPALMIQGTSSGAGKSLLTAALCRILLEDGFRVAPFKSQNMSLNSYVTRDGGEMGRAQVLQAEACRLLPDVRMNPVLLKPSSDTGAQVIVMGRPVGQMGVGQYIQYKKNVFDTAKKAYDDLALEHDVMVIEGAGSPAEINLARHDIVNMAMAEHADAKVVITGDIDRGGVFAAFSGTMDALKERERERVLGFVINRFRGNRALLKEGLEWVHHVTGRPVLGVVPYLKRLGLPEEDSVALDSPRSNERRLHDDTVTIGVVHLPHISNFTDFDALDQEDDVSLQYLHSPKELNRVCALILPGSKNVMADASYMKENGWFEGIKKSWKAGTEIMGICGGLQILGERIEDNHAIESFNGSVDGIGLLPLKTELAVIKTLRVVEGCHLFNGCALRGYEIHHGCTSNEGAVPVIERNDGEIIGYAGTVGRVWGTYLHGIFDADEFRRTFINSLRIRSGLEPVNSGNRYDIEPSLKRLADAVRESIDVQSLYKAVGLI